MSAGLQTFLMYLIAILMLLFTVSIHEIGHFLMGLKFKVNVKEISIGIGPRLAWKTTKSGIKISLKLIPLVAYVLFDSKQLRELYADDIEDKNYNWYMSPLPEGKKLLEDTKMWQYLLIMVAGVAVNFISFLILWPCCWATFRANGFVLDNPFVSLGLSLKAIGSCMVFKGGNGSNIFVDIPDLAGNNNWGLIFFQLLILMNLITAVFNIIPFPPLDGWKVFERIYIQKAKKPISEKVETILSLIGLFLMVYIFISSILVKWIHW